jgi:hypothetical protein
VTLYDELVVTNPEARCRSESSMWLCISEKDIANTSPGEFPACPCHTATLSFINERPTGSKYSVMVQSTFMIAAVWSRRYVTVAGYDYSSKGETLNYLYALIFRPYGLLKPDLRKLVGSFVVYHFASKHIEERMDSPVEYYHPHQETHSMKD